MSKDWIKGAIKRPGALKEKAKRAGMTVAAYSAKMGKKSSNASTRTRRQIALRNTLNKVRKG